MKDLLHLIDSLSGSRVLCVGDAILDHFVDGRASRISAEAPVPVIVVSGEAFMGGGAGNVLRNLHVLGGKPGYIGVLGEDERGRDLTRLLAEECRGAEITWVIAPERKTPLKSRYLASGQQIVRIDYDDNAPLSDETEALFLKNLALLLPQYDTILISDNRTGALSDKLIGETIAQARKQKIPVLADSKRRDYSVFEGATLVKPNRLELERAVGRPIDGEETLVEAARELIGRHNIKAALVTRSEEGMSYITASSATHIATAAQRVYDVSGAGDTVMAVMGLCHASGLEPVPAMHLANLAAGIVVGKRMTATVSREEMKDRLRRKPLRSSHDKIMALEALEARIEKWRERGFRIGFTNGCFDIFHAGHAILLEKARGQCDRLIVGLNDDFSVRALKGDSRPVNGEGLRARLLAGLGHVDAVILFPENSPGGLIEKLRPDIVIKGSDYGHATLPEAPIIEAYGGEIAFVPFEEGLSSSNMIEKIKAGQSVKI